jgi:hypothetical protein
VLPFTPAAIEDLRQMRNVLLVLLLSIQLSFAAACARAPEKPSSPAKSPAAAVMAAPQTPAAADPAIAQLEAELAAEPSNAAVIYALAMIHDRRGRVPEALGWLERLAGTTWDAGVDPADFAHSRVQAAARYDAARIAIERRWVRAPRAREHVRIGERDLLPEGMERDPATGELLLSSGRKRKIVRVGQGGATRDVVRPAQDGLLATLGLRVDAARGLVWVASAAAPFMERAEDAPAGTSRLHAFELASGRLRARYELSGPSLLNDVAVLPDGRAVVTDTAADMLWITGDGKLEPLLPAGSLSSPNGIAVAPGGDLLYVAHWRGIAVVDWRARRAEPLRVPAGSTHTAGIDGLYLHDGALVGIQNAVGHPRVLRVPLAPGGRAALRVDVIESGSPIVDNPATGVVVGGELVFLARRNREHGFVGGAAGAGAAGAPPGAALEDIVVAAVRLASE